jgi:hypothetical protein
MSKLEYGRYIESFNNPDDNSWTRLNSINEFLEAGEAVPFHLAQWLGHAIRFSDHDPDEFIKRLGLRRAKGRPAHKYGKDAWLKWGERIWQLESAGKTIEQAIVAVGTETGLQYGEEVSRSQLQKWRNEYDAARNPVD